MKKQIYLLLVAVALNLSNDAQAASLSSTRRAFTPLFRQAEQAISQGRSGLSQSVVNTARQCVIKPTGTLTTPSIRTSELLSKAGTMPTRASSSVSFDSEQMRSNYGWWQQIKNSPTAKWFAGLLAGGAFIKTTGYAAAEEEAKNPHFEELLKSEYGPTPGMIRVNTELLFNAVDKGNIDEARDAIEKAGVNIITDETVYKDKNESWYDKGSPWTHAIKKNNPAMIQFFIEQGVDINKPIFGNLTPLNYAILKNSSDVAQFLIKNGANIEAHDYFSTSIFDNAAKTPLMNAAAEHNIEMVNALLEAGAKVNYNLYDTYTSENALMLAMRRNAGHRDWPNNSAWSNNIAVVNALLKAGANVHTADKYGNKPLHEAAFRGKTEIAQALLNAGARVNSPNDNYKTPLMYAAQGGELETLQVLLKAGADVNNRDIFGRTALWEAADEGHLDIVRELVDAGADVNIKDKDGKTALDVAKEEKARTDSKSYMSPERKADHKKKLVDIIECLKTHGAKE